jgi:eukaryotic-like serine/threonine-protein kinase
MLQTRRCTLFRLLHTLSFSFAALTCLALCSPASDGTMFRGDPAHLGVYQSTTSPTLSAVKWKFKTRGKVVSSATVAEGAVYFGSTDSNLYALDASTGALRWKFTSGGPVNSSPAISGAMVYFASLDGAFYALDTVAGKLAWKFQTGGERRFTAPGIHGILPKMEVMPDPFDVFLSSPAFLNGIVYFGSGDHNVYALDSHSGALKWKFTTGNVVHASPAVVRGVVYIGSWDRYLYALDAESGKMLWRFETGDDQTIYNQVGIASSAAVADGIVYFGCRDGHFYAVDAHNGARKWVHDNQMGWVIASPAVQNGVVYFPTSDGTRFKALNAASGKVVFSVPNKDVSFSSPAIVNGVAYYGTTDGWLHAVDIKTGKVTAEFQTEGSKANSHTYLNEHGAPDPHKIFPDQTLDGIMVGLNRIYSLGSVLASPVVADGILFIGSTDGNLYALQ